jgi:hypothetical protein
LEIVVFLLATFVMNIIFVVPLYLLVSFIVRKMNKSKSMIFWVCSTVILVLLIALNSLNFTNLVTSLIILLLVHVISSRKERKNE